MRFYSLSSPVTTTLLPVLLTFALACGGCSSLGLSSDDTKPKEPRELTKSKSSSTAQQPELTLLLDAQKYYERGLYSVARESFIRIKEDYPTGAYAEYAAIKAADCLFEQKDFRGASKEYEEVLNAAPAKISLEKTSSSKHSDYLIYRAALSNQLLDPGSARDTSRLEHAKDLFDRLTKDYPKSPYATIGHQHSNEIEHSLAKNDLALLAYYQERDKTAVLSARDKDFKNKYGIEPRRFSAEEDEAAAKPDTSDTPVTDKAADTPKKQEEPATKGSADTDRPEAEPSHIKHVYISAMTCDPASNTATLEISGDTAGFSEADVISVQDATGIEIQSPVARRVSRNGERSDCISRQDLIISPHGEFKFLGADAVHVEPDAQPPRIVISVNTN